MLSGAQVTRLWPYGGPGSNYGSFAGKAGTPPEITTLVLANGQVGVAYSATLEATGSLPITWAVTVGVLPSGLSLDTDTGVLSGTPTAAGSYSFTVEATNAAGSDTQNYAVTITAVSEAFTGGFWYAYDLARDRYKKRLKELDELEEQAKEIADETDREIAQFLHADQRQEVEAEERKRLQELARNYSDSQASNLLGERVAKAMARASVQGNFSAVEAFMREVERAREEEDWLLRATMLLIELN